MDYGDNSSREPLFPLLSCLLPSLNGPCMYAPVPFSEVLASALGPLFPLPSPLLLAYHLLNPLHDLTHTPAAPMCKCHGLPLFTHCSPNPADLQSAIVDPLYPFLSRRALCAGIQAGWPVPAPGVPHSPAETRGNRPSAYTVLELRLNLAWSFVLGKESTFASIVRRLSVRPYIVLS